MTGIHEMFAELGGRDRYEYQLEVVGAWVRAREVDRAIEWARTHRERKLATNRRYKARRKARAKTDPALAEKLRVQKRIDARKYRAGHREECRRKDRDYRRQKRAAERAARMDLTP